MAVTGWILPRKPGKLALKAALAAAPQAGRGFIPAGMDGFEGDALTNSPQHQRPGKSTRTGQSGSALQPGRRGRPGRREQSARIVGWREFVGLPDFNIAQLRAKIDSGARTSALHAENQETYDLDGVKWVRFSFPSPEGKRYQILEAPVVDERQIKNTSGIFEWRIIIKTTLLLGAHRTHIDVSLADRKRMEFDLILGRTALRPLRLTIDPGRSFLLSKPALRYTEKHAAFQ